ncbi:PaaI family thioesterase [Roseitranquillus sediminis]|uniref:PaaI family thioesterase n=1 Tax=Roseitranquillus sediminis TaxID=2809051 RepID=UPI001D0CDA7C|nr:PaaI family thioesterase [Roseitranquillus sediminis]MBM9595524.1 PaaI family thioesterase [Roseitranquillus sediminis]
MDADALASFLATEFPQVASNFEIMRVMPMQVEVRMPVTERNLRPGGTVSGPSMFALADVAVYLAILAMIGPRSLAVTTNCSIDFMRKPAAEAAMTARAELLKLGRTLAVGDVRMFSDSLPEPVARASLTYSIPPLRVRNG